MWEKLMIFPIFPAAKTRNIFNMHQKKVQFYDNIALKKVHQNIIQKQTN